MLHSFMAAIICAVFPLGLLAVQRQVPAPARVSTELVVRIAYDNDRAVTDLVRVQLLNVSGVPVMESFTRGEGEVRFLNVQPGMYRLRASGIGIEETTSSSSFAIQPRELMHLEFLQVRRHGTAAPSSTEGTISAALLNVPRKAESEFDKGVSALKKQKLDEAEKRFSRAAEYYPRYAAAFNNLGVIAMRRGRVDEGKNYFSQAVKADEQYAPPYLNLAKALIGAKDHPQALQVLTKANSLEPGNLEVLALLTMVEYDSHQLDRALGHARQVHGIAGHERFAFAHYIAGKALEAQGQHADAVTEFRLFLKEAPQSPSAPKVQASIEALEKQRR